MQHITVKWYGPYNFERLHLHDVAVENGIYAISRVWGDTETLLYIGKTERDFKRRIKEHERWLKDYRGQVKLRLGKLLDTKNSAELLADVEALLIILNESVVNTRNTDSYSGRPLIIHNRGRRGLIDKIVSYYDNRLRDA